LTFIFTEIHNALCLSHQSKNYLRKKWGFTCCSGAGWDEIYWGIETGFLIIFFSVFTRTINFDVLHLRKIFWILSSNKRKKVFAKIQSSMLVKIRPQKIFFENISDELFFQFFLKYEEKVHFSFS